MANKPRFICHAILRGIIMSSLIELKKKINEEKSLEEFIFGAFYKTNFLFKLSHEEVQRIFHELKEQDEYKDHIILKELIFDESLIFPYSEKIDSALFRIGVCKACNTQQNNKKSYEKFKEHKIEQINDFVIDKITKIKYLRSLRSQE